MQMVLESFAATGLSSDAQWTCALSKTVIQLEPPGLFICMCLLEDGIRAGGLAGEARPLSTSTWGLSSPRLCFLGLLPELLVSEAGSFQS